MSRWDEMRAQHRTRTQERIVAAAVELVRQHGVGGVSMSQLAERAGVSRPTLYQHFPDLEHVLAMWVDGAVSTFLADVTQLLAAHDDPLDRLEAYVRAQCVVFAGAPYGLSATNLASGGPHGPVLTSTLALRLRDIRDLVRDVLDDARRAAVVRPDLDAGLTADLVLGVVEGVRPHVVSGALDVDHATQEVVRLIRDGVRPANGRN